MSFEEQGLPKIREALKDGPYLVSALGEMLAEDERPTEKLRQALNSAGIKTQRVGNGPKIYAYLPEHSDKIAALTGETVTPQFKHAVILAFTKEVSAENKMALKLHPKTEYNVIPLEAELEEGAFLVEEDYRIPTKHGQQLPTEIIATLHDKIVLWCENHDVSKDLLLWKERKTLPAPSSEISLEVFIQKFYAAQPERIRYDVNLPGFVIQHFLSKIDKNG